MTYFRVDDKLHDHRKSRRARKGAEGGRSAAAIGLWTLAGSWSMANGSDGWVPTDELDRWDDTAEQLAAQLVAAELWHPAEQDGEPGFRFHEWDEWQHSTAYLDKRRRVNADRMRTKRANETTTTEATDPAPVVVEPPTKPKAAPKSAVTKAGDDFERFWQLYPRKTGKEAAAKAFTKARSHTDVATIAAGLHNACQVWTTTATEAQFIPHPSTWLNEGRWDDERPLDGMPSKPGAQRPTVTLAQCDGTDCPGTKHEWADAGHRMVCQGVGA